MMWQATIAIHITPDTTIIKTTIGNLILSMVAATGLHGRVDQLNNPGDDVVDLEGTPRGVLSPLVDPRDVYSCPSPLSQAAAPPQLSLPPGRWGGSFNGAINRAPLCDRLSTITIDDWWLFWHLHVKLNSNHASISVLSANLRELFLVKDGNNSHLSA